MAGEDVATCPSCSLIVRVIYDAVSDCSSVLMSSFVGQEKRHACLLGGGKSGSCCWRLLGSIFSVTR